MFVRFINGYKLIVSMYIYHQYADVNTVTVDVFKGIPYAQAPIENLRFSVSHWVIIIIYNKISILNDNLNNNRI